VVLVYALPSGRDAVSITTKGLKPIVGHEVYAVWIAAWETAGARLVGAIEPSIGRGGKLIVQGLLPRGTSGAYQLLITRQREARLEAPGPAVLEGSIDF
jgi:hypothetical protein